MAKGELLTKNLNRMSKRCELQKEYYQQHGNYKGNGKYSDKYVSWLEEQILALRIHDVSGQLPNNLILYRQAKKLDYSEFCKWINAKLGN